MAVGQIGAEEEALLPEQPRVEDESHDRGEHPRDAHFVDADLHEPVAAREGDADVLAAHVGVVRARAEMVRQRVPDAVREDQELRGLRPVGHAEPDEASVGGSEERAVPRDDVHFVEVALPGDEGDLLRRKPPRPAQLLGDRIGRVHEHRVDRAVERRVEVEHRVVEHRLRLAEGALRERAPRKEDEDRVEDGRRAREDDPAPVHGTISKTELRPVISKTPCTIALGCAIDILPPHAIIAF